MSHVTTHVLDSALGVPAAGVTVMLLDQDGLIATAKTNADGRVADLGPDALEPGTYALIFDTSAYFHASDTAAFYPRVTIEFLLTDADAHYHVPLLLSPFGYSTYRGS
jgi:5-hydroxyisourate hydrolase